MTTLTSRETNDFDRFDRIYKEYAARMVVFARRFVSDEFAEDIVQDVFVRIWQQERFLMPTSELRSYLYRSVLNGCRNAIRHEMVADRFARNSLAELRLGEVEYELRVLDEPRDERTERLLRSIEELPDRCREVFRLSWYDELRSDEIAARLGISRRTVDAQLYKALRFLRERMRVLLLSALASPFSARFDEFFVAGVGNSAARSVLWVKTATDEGTLPRAGIRSCRLS